MAVNENGNLLDDGGNIVIDHVWGNLPMQPNDVRAENGGGLLDPDLDNHNIAYEGWNGYPLFTPNTAGAEGAGYIVVPSVLGLTTAIATRVLTDDGLVVTAGTAATNAAIVVTGAARTAASSTLTFTATGAGAAFPVGTKVVVTGFTAPDTALNATHTVTASATDSISVVTTATTAVALTEQTASVVGLAGTIKTQSVAAGANEIEAGDAITITAFAAAS
jgi:hypothetical protein